MGFEALAGNNEKIWQKRSQTWTSNPPEFLSFELTASDILLFIALDSENKSIY
jgi:hypothetical protein